LSSSQQAQQQQQERRIVIVGGRRLSGTIPVGGSKNAAVALFAGALLASEGVSILHNLPRISDLATMAELFRHLGVSVEFSPDRRSARIDARGLNNHEAPGEIVARMRASFWILGPVLARLGRVRVAQPGGCNIGARAIDQHLKGLRALGADIDDNFGSVNGEARHGLRGAPVYLDMPSVGATMNIMMAAALSEGATVLENAAQEPDVEDLGNFLRAMGARVSGHGTGELTVTGVKTLRGAEYTAMPDRIEAGTLGLAGGITGGDVFLQGANPAHLRPITAKMAEIGMRVEEQPNGVRVIGREPGQRLRATRLTALPHPGFPTDMQQPFTAALCLADGTASSPTRCTKADFAI
jgi:UDP-N-acetylglucosamine 1-carboxyvinyltransferase